MVYTSLIFLLQIKQMVKMVNSKKFHVLFFFLTVFSILTSSNFVKVNAQIPNEANSEFFMGIQILESDQQAILDSIEKVKELNLRNTQTSLLNSSGRAFEVHLYNA